MGVPVLKQEREREIAREREREIASQSKLDHHKSNTYYSIWYVKVRIMSQNLLLFILINNSLMSDDP